MIEILLIILIILVIGSVFYLKKSIDSSSENQQDHLSKDDLNHQFSETNNTLKSVLESLGALKQSAEQASTSSSENYRDMITKITNVERVFTTNKTRGDLGEYVVERIIEWVGLKEGEGKFWDKQKSFGNSQPDFTFYFPNGSYVHLGFKPAWIILKRASASGNAWGIFDNKRSTSNPNTKSLFSNLNYADYTSNTAVDFLANGFKLRSNATYMNASGHTYLYMAFAETPDATPFDTFPNAK